MALKALVEMQDSNEFQVVSISGTSGGAVCASLIWYSFMKGERFIWKRVAQNWAEESFNCSLKAYA